MTYKYHYPGLKGIMDAQYMLYYFPELTLLIQRKELISRIISINIFLGKNPNKQAEIAINIMGHDNTYGIMCVDTLLNETLINDIKILVPPEMNSFFDEFTREDTVKIYTSENCFNDYPEDTMEELTEQYKGCEIIKRRDIPVKLPERL